MKDECHNKNEKAEKYKKKLKHKIDANDVESSLITSMFTSMIG